MITAYKKISIQKQCELLSVSRSTHYYVSKEGNDEHVITKVVELYKKYPVYGYRRITAELNNKGLNINRKKVYRIMKNQRICAIFPGSKTTVIDPKAYKYPYLLKKSMITKPHDVWQVDLTYLRTPHGFIYLTALIDVYSRYVVGYSLSNTLDTQSCIWALERAILTHGLPRMINSDQGTQFTSDLWTQCLQRQGIVISMTGKGRSNDNAYIERLWRTLKSEWFYIYGARQICEYKKLLIDFLAWYNNERPHQALKYQTPSKVLDYARLCENVENPEGFPTIPQLQQQIC